MSGGGGLLLVKLVEELLHRVRVLPEIGIVELIPCGKPLKSFRTNFVDFKQVD